MNKKLDTLLKKGLTKKKAGPDYLMTVADLYDNYDIKHALSFVLPQMTQGIDIMNNPDGYPPEVVEKVRETMNLKNDGMVLDYIIANLDKL